MQIFLCSYGRSVHYFMEKMNLSNLNLRSFKQFSNNWINNFYNKGREGNTSFIKRIKHLQIENLHIILSCNVYLVQWLNATRNAKKNKPIRLKPVTTSQYQTIKALLKYAF